MSVFKKTYRFIKENGDRIKSLFTSLCVIGMLLVAYFAERAIGFPVPFWKIALLIIVGGAFSSLGFWVAFSKNKGG